MNGPTIAWRRDSRSRPRRQATHATRQQRIGPVGLGMAWRAAARFGTPATEWRGTARPGSAGLGAARHGSNGVARQGQARHGAARQGAAQRELAAFMRKYRDLVDVAAMLAEATSALQAA